MRTDVTASTSSRMKRKTNVQGEANRPREETFCDVAWRTSDRREPLGLLECRSLSDPRCAGAAASNLGWMPAGLHRVACRGPEHPLKSAALTGEWTDNQGPARSAAGVT